MRAFQRLKHTVSVSIESLLDQIENQEAVAIATVRQIEQGAARVRMHRKRCERRIAELEQRTGNLESAARTWKERARRFRDDHDKALECVRRHQASKQARTVALHELENERQLLLNVQDDEQALATKLDDLRRRCAALSSREARSAAEGGSATTEDIEAVFDRWESRIEQREVLRGGGPAAPDLFERSLSKEEAEVELERALESILSEEEVQS